LFDDADDCVNQAKQLRANSTGPNPDADRLEARAAELVKGAIALDVQNEAARVKAYHDKWVGQHKAHGDWTNEQTKSLISMSQSAIRLVLTINAGAAVALIAFLGNAVGKNANAVADLFAGSLVVFATGVAVAALVSVGSYVTQFLYGEDESPTKQSWARRLHVVTLIGWFCGLGVFGWGCFQTYHAMQSMAKSGIGGKPPTIESQAPAPPAPPVKVILEGSIVIEPPRVPLKKNAPPPKRPPNDPPSPPPPPASK
jgi:hypothetical protein